MVTEHITVERLRELLIYKPLTGIFIWRVNVGARGKAGRIAGGAHHGTRNQTAYWLIKVDKKLYRAHRLAWLYVNGTLPDSEIDHKDTNGLNNALYNLRLATPAQNQANTRVYTNNRAGIKGVRAMPSGKYIAQIKHNKIVRYLGTHETKEAAAAAYRTAAQELHGEFARW
jgi:hypothetical protein